MPKIVQIIAHFVLAKLCLPTTWKLTVPPSRMKRMKRIPGKFDGNHTSASAPQPCKAQRTAENTLLLRDGKSISGDALFHPEICKFKVLALHCGCVLDLRTVASE